MDAYLHVNDFYLPQNTCIYMHLQYMYLHLLFTPMLGGAGVPRGGLSPGLGPGARGYGLQLPAVPVYDNP